MSQSFIPRVTPNAQTIINSKSDDTFFIMQQCKPEKYFDLEELDLQPHCIRNSGSYDKMIRFWNALESKINYLHSQELVELFSRGEGRDYVNMIVFKGREVITLTLCTKERAKALAL